MNNSPYEEIFKDLLYLVYKKQVQGDLPPKLDLRKLAVISSEHAEIQTNLALIIAPQMDKI